MWGPGGNGGGDGTNDAAAATGGGSGAYCSRTIAVTPGNTFTYTVGTTSGAATTFVNGTGPATNMSAGSGGNGNGNGGAVGSGGTASGGTTNTTGANGSANTGSSGGKGGDAPNGGGAGGPAVATGTDGSMGTAPGGGGGGGGDRDASSTTAGAGGAGRISISFSVTSAGTDQTLASCATTTTMAATAPSAGTGTWTCVTNCAGVSIQNLTSESTSVSGLTPGLNTTMRWTVTNGGCTTTTDDVVLNTVAAAGCWSYCTPNFPSGVYSISNVNINTINNASATIAGGATPVHEDYIGVSTSLVQGTTYTLTVQTTGAGAANTFYVNAFFDWNNNGVFTDAGEQFDIGTVAQAGTATVSINIAVPVGATLGATTMRVMYKFTGYSTPCNTTNYGQSEDYTVVISTAHCSNGIQDADETGVDCGGADCVGCGGTCFDGIWNNGETDVDCGGTCALPCTDQTGITSVATCPASNMGDVYRVYCDQIGTTAYDYASPQVMVSDAVATLPSPSPTCSSSPTTHGSWVRFDLEAGVTQMNFNFNTGTMATGNSTVFVAAYQGTGCGALTFNSCQKVEEFISSSYGIYAVSISSLNDAQDLWLYFFNDNNKDFDLSFDFIGIGAAPANTSTAAQATYATTCPTTLSANGDACNLGAPGAAFTTPAAGGEPCTGGNWGSNENTTFYTFTASATTGTLDIGSIVCNDGSASSGAQFGVWNSCGSIGTYGAAFLGCAVGSSAISLTGLTIGSTYYIASDGYAGNNCRWSFDGSSVFVLPIELSDFYAQVEKNGSVKLDWITSSENNNDYFTIERSSDAEHFEEVRKVKGAGNSNVPIGYTEHDSKPYQGTSYYRLKQTDFDGKSTYSKLVSVNVNSTYNNVNIVPNPLRGTGYFVFSSEGEMEVVLSIYSASGVLMEAQPLLITEGFNKLELPTEHLTKGMYFVRMEGADGENITRKFIKE